MFADNHSRVLAPRIVEEGELFDRGIRQTLLRLTAFEKWMIVVGLSLATSVELGVQFATNIILPDMQGNVAASQDEISWVITVYAAAFLAVLPLTNWFVRRLGHRNYLVLSLLLYASGALGCFLSSTLPSLLGARALMGVGGGAFLVRALSALFRLYSPKERARALLLFGLLLNASRALMPILFGVVADAERWKFAFLAIVPLPLLAALCLYLFIPRRLEFESEPPPADLIAIGLLVTGLVAFQVTMSRGEQDMWLQSPLIRLMLLVSILCLAVFAWWDTRRKNPNPILSLRLLSQEPGLASGLVLAVILGTLLTASVFVLPQYLRRIEGYSATQAALFFCCDAVATYLGIIFGARFTPKLSARAVMLLGLALFAAANHLLVVQLTPDTPASNLLLILALHGSSLGMLLPAVTAILVGHARPRFLSFDMTIYYFFRGLGGVVGIGATIALLDVRETIHSSRLLDTANRINPIVHRFIVHLGHVLYAKGLTPGIAEHCAYQLFRQLAVRQSALLAFIDVFWCFEVLALVSMVLVLLTSWRRKPGNQ
ncbi:MAG TPA: MFS transporter [Bryobacteraceae bacterium]|nr:MFS transporter [Candidatus Acidoferrales bacterium]